MENKFHDNKTQLQQTTEVLEREKVLFSGWECFQNNEMFSRLIDGGH